jgi:hypothetical protein
VLLHDADLVRVASIGQRLNETSSAQLQDIDVGSWFDPQFGAERVLTLQEVIDLARGRIKLQHRAEVHVGRSAAGRESRPDDPEQRLWLNGVLSSGAATHRRMSAAVVGLMIDSTRLESLESLLKLTPDCPNATMTNVSRAW